MGRHVRELFDLVPPDPAERDRLFTSLLKSDALATDRGVAGKLADLQEKRRALRPAAKKPGRAVAHAEEEKLEAEEPEEEPVLADAEVAEDFAADKKRKSDRSKDRGRRQAVRQLYRAPDATRAYVEHNYWHRRIEEHNADLVRVNALWRDYALAPADAPFVSTNVAEAAGSFAEMMFALSVLDLPFEAKEPESKVDGSQLTLRATTPLLLVRKELVETEPAEEKTPILVSQNFYRLDERYQYDGNERRDAFVTGEFLAGVAYGCQVVVTNPTSSPHELELLLQIPQGAIPVQRGFYTRGVVVRLDGYATQSLDYAFYFPHPGAAPHYPVHVARVAI